MGTQTIVIEHPELEPEVTSEQLQQALQLGETTAEVNHLKETTEDQQNEIQALKVQLEQQQSELSQLRQMQQTSITVVEEPEPEPEIELITPPQPEPKLEPQPIQTKKDTWLHRGINWMLS